MRYDGICRFCGVPFSRCVRLSTARSAATEIWLVDFVRTFFKSFFSSSLRSVRGACLSILFINNNILYVSLAIGQSVWCLLSERPTDLGDCQQQWVIECTRENRCVRARDCLLLNEIQIYRLALLLQLQSIGSESSDARAKRETICYGQMCHLMYIDTSNTRCGQRNESHTEQIWPLK